jgi:hypothetical protein
MDLSWLPLVALGIGLYFFFLMAYRLWVAGKALFGAASRTMSLFAALERYDRSVPAGKQAVTTADLERVVFERRKLVNRRRKEQAERQRRLVNRIREIEIDKRWA